MSFRMTITTRGVNGAGPLLNEFVTNIPKVLGQKPLEEYANDVVDNMSAEAPVDTGYLRSNIRFNRVDAQSVMINSWAPYSGWVDQGTRRMVGRPFFSNNALSSAVIGGHLMGDASVQYLRILINKYQNQP